MYCFAKLDSTFRQETNNNQDNKWEKPKSPAKRAFPPTWEPTTSNRFDRLNVEDESKHDLDSNDHIQIQLTNVKVAVGTELSTNRNLKELNYYDRMCENCHISASTTSRHLKIGKERAYTVIYHKMNLFLSRSNYVSNNMA